MILLAGTANQPLAQAVAQQLKIELGRTKIEVFSDGEIYLNIEASLKNQLVYIIQSGRGGGGKPVHRYLMELLILIDAAKLLRPKKIIVILPFLPYRRQVEKTEKGESITALLIGRLLKAAGANEVVCLDLHEPGIIPHFGLPVTHLTAFPLFVDYFRRKKIQHLAVVSPDDGSHKRSQALATALKVPLVSFEKSRARLHDVVATMQMHGEVNKRNLIILDDEINTAGTLVEAITHLKEQGAANIYFACTHGVLSGPAMIRLKQSPVKEVVVTNSMHLEPEQKLTKLKILSVAPLIANYIKKNH